MLNVLDCTPIAQFAIGLDHRITCWNRVSELLTGFSAKEMIGTDRGLFLPDARDSAGSAATRCRCRALLGRGHARQGRIGGVRGIVQKTP